MLSVVIPAYNEENNIDFAVNRVGEVLRTASIEYEIVFIDDGSGDKTWSKIQKASSESSAIRGARFSRNFGKEAAISAGLFLAKGDCVVVIDCDMQHPPEKIPEMYSAWEEGYELVECVKSKRGNESAIHGMFASLFYSLISKATGLDMKNASDFKLMDRKVVSAILSFPEQKGFFRAISGWVGFSSKKIEFEVEERKSGSSKWSTFGLIKYAVNNIASFSSAPLFLVMILGALMLIVSFCISVIALVQKVKGVALDGFTTVIIMQCFTSSFLMICLGIIGFYISQIYDEIKKRPKYIIMEETKGGD